MSVILPTSPAPTDGTQPSFLDWGGTLRPIFGGALQKLRRLGDRFAISVVMPPMTNADSGRVWIARLIRGRGEGVVLPWPQPGFDPGAPGAPLVKGANQSGSTLAIDGFAPGYQVVEGQFFSIVHGGRRYLHVATADVVASAQGEATVSFSPMLRIKPADNAVCEFAQPMIEGLLGGDEQSWTPSAARTVGLTFSIQEAK